MSENKSINIVIAGLGGQGVIKASDIIAEVAYGSGLDVKKSELHGMSQRGGSVASDIRFGERVYSPMVPMGEADYLVVTAADQVEVNRAVLKDGGVLIEIGELDVSRLKSAKSVNIALLGALSRHLEFSEEAWLAAIRVNLPEKLHAANFEAFALGRGAL